MKVSSSLYLAVLCGTFLSLLLGYGSLGCVEEEKVGLLKLKAYINHPNGTALYSWGGEVGDCCRWESITCDNKTNRVIQLSLRYIDAGLGRWSLNCLPTSSLPATANFRFVLQRIDRHSRLTKYPTFTQGSRSWKQLYKFFPISRTKIFE